MLRMEKAKEMLWNTRKNITDIAVDVGYSSSQYFSNVFSAYTGMSPGKFRNSCGELLRRKNYNKRENMLRALRRDNPESVPFDNCVLLRLKILKGYVTTKVDK